MINININLSFLIETISEMKHTLNSYFIAPYILILRTKIAICA